MATEEVSRLRRSLDWATVIAGVSVLALLLFELGFPLTQQGQQGILVATQVGLWLTLIAETLRIILHPERRRYLRRYPSEVVMTGVLFLLLILKPLILPALLPYWPHTDATRGEVLYLGALQLTIMGGLLQRLLHFNQLLAFARVSPRAILIGSYLGLIGIGTLLLMLPRATTAPGSLSALDALFTSTSAVCVTGLIVVDTATVFTPFGQSILLVLFQLGGLGLMTFTYFFVSLFGGGITIRDRAILLDFLNEEHVGRISGSLVAIIGMTFAFETVGAVLLHLAIEQNAPGHASWFDSVFHSVSAFCNAGFSTYSLGLYDPLTRHHGWYQSVIMSLIVVGGLGFPVLKNVWDHARERILHRRARPPRLTTHTRVVLVTTVALIFGGALLIYLFDLAGTGRPGGVESAWGALFTSITARTAGFNTAPIDGLLPATAIIVIVLMFIGAAPASTAGGIKTTTFAVALLNTLRILRNSTGDLVAFGRKIPPHLANRAFAVALLAIGWVTMTTIVLTALLPEQPVLDLAFEAVSAFGTVGLSRGLTAELPPFGQGIIIASMVVGRIGILYFALGVLGKEQRGRIVYPEENVIIS
jgi:trk system potassium uptake protein